MIFKLYLAEAIIQGSKTQTRRLKKSHHNAVSNKGHIIAVYSNAKLTTHRSNRLLWRIGKTYAVQPGRTKKAVGRFKLLAIREEPLCSITENDVAAEGISYRLKVLPAFARLWDSINTKPGARWKDNPTVWVLTFELKEQQQDNYECQNCKRLFPKPKTDWHKYPGSRRCPHCSSGKYRRIEQ